MREILFRGKRKDNGEWVYGYYTELPVGSLSATIFSNDDEIVCEDTADYIIKVFAKQHSNYSNSIPLQVIECETYEVIPDTIGQFTGMCDKNGERIFEGDILKYLDSDVEVNYFSIVYQDSAFLVEDCGIIEPELLTSYECLELELAGNIFDNSELLEVR